MELRQIEHFLAVAEEMNFSRAGHRLHLGQSAVSSSIRALERDLGADLFVRTSRSVGLTQAGSALLPTARRMIAAADEGRNAVSAVTSLLTGSVRIGLIQTLGVLDVPGVVRMILDRYPGLRLHLNRGMPADLAADVARGALDLALVPTPDDPPAGVQSVLLRREEMVVMTSPFHPLADRVGVDLVDLADEPWIDFIGGTQLRHLADEASRSVGFSRNIVVDVAEISLLLELVERGVGIAIVPRSTTEQAGFPGIPIRHPVVEREVSLLRPVNRRSRAAEAVIGAFLSANRRTNHTAVRDDGAAGA